ncbi:PH domain-containing protein [Brachybacterium sp. FME24]|uniref:PH domain-containing protein n=1 Tax=Brachybacterium sp. FME24 TaxID=2742605 RepID=UPI0018695726|nr:PH domain-containing protein [Brachybacterium sp. FME24]
MSWSVSEKPAGQERPTIVLRPRMVRVFAYITGVIVLGGMIGGALVMPSFQLGGRLGLVAVGVLIFLFCHLEASVRLVARSRVLEVRNVFRARTLEWAEIVDVSFPMGDPWAHLDLADGSTLAVNALQRYDGKRAIAAAHRLRALVQERGEAPGTDLPAF